MDETEATTLEEQEVLDDHEEETEIPLEKLTQMVVLVSLSVSKPQLQRQIKAEDVTIMTAEGLQSIQAEDRTDPVWTLVPKSWVSRFSKLESRARSILQKNGVGFAARGCTMVSLLAVDRVFEELSEIKKEFTEAVNEFAEEFPAILAERRDRMGHAQFDALAKNLPEPGAIRNRFGMRWMVIPLERLDVGVFVSEIQSVSSALTEAGVDLPEVFETLNRIVDRMQDTSRAMHRDAVRPEMEQARREFSSQISATVREMALEPQRRLLAAIEDFRSKISEGRTLRTSSLNQLREAFQSLEDFAFLADPDILTRMRECRTLLSDLDLREVNSTRSISNALSAAMDDIASMATAPLSEDGMGRRVRNIRPIGQA